MYFFILFQIIYYAVLVFLVTLRLHVLKQSALGIILYPVKTYINHAIAFVFFKDVREKAKRYLCTHTP